MNSADDIRVLVADDHPVVRRGLSLMLKYEEGMEAVGEANNGLEVVDLFRQLQPDVTLIDLRMPQMSGVQAISAVRQEYPNARFIVLTTYEGDEDIYQGLRAGAKGYLLKGASCEELLEAIRTVHAGQKYIPAKLGMKLIERMSSKQLSDRELDVLRLMAKGKSNQEIAQELGITEGTVKFHVNNILGKFQVSDRTSAVIVAFRRGLASLE